MIACRGVPIQSSMMSLLWPKLPHAVLSQLPLPQWSLITKHHTCTFAQPKLQTQTQPKQPHRITTHNHPIQVNSPTTAPHVLVQLYLLQPKIHSLVSNLPSAPSPHSSPKSSLPGSKSTVFRLESILQPQIYSQIAPQLQIYPQFQTYSPVQIYP